MYKCMSVIAAIVLLVVSTGVGAQTLEIACEENWPPYVMTEDGSITGFSWEVLSNVFDTMGVSYRITPYPWNRALKMVLEGEADALFNASPKPDREERCYYPEEDLFNSRYVFFILKENAGKLKYESFDDLKGYNIGVCDGYSYSAEFLDFLKTQESVISGPGDETLLKMLHKGRIDFFPAELGNGMAILKKLGIQDAITYLPKPLLEKPYYLIFNKQRVEQAFVDKFSNALRDFKETSEYKSIYAAYFGAE